MKRLVDLAVTLAILTVLISPAIAQKNESKAKKAQENKEENKKADGAEAGKKEKPKKLKYAFKKGDRIAVIRTSKLRIPERVLGELNSGIVLEVLEINEPWLWVRSGQAGWIDGNNAIPLDKALKHFNDAIKKDSQNAELYQARAHILRNDKKNRKALADYTKSIELAPDNSFAYKNRAFTYYLLGEHEKAIEDYNKSIKRNAKDAFALNNRGHNYFKLKRYEQAKADYEAALKLAPQHVLALNNVAWLLATCPDAKIRNGKKAVGAGETACVLTNWKDFDYIDTLAAALAENGEFKKAVAVAEKAIEVAPKDEHDLLKQRLALYKKKIPYRDAAK